MFGSSLNYDPRPSGTSGGSNQNQTDPYQQTSYGPHLFLQQPIHVYPPPVYNTIQPQQHEGQQLLGEHFVFEENLQTHLLGPNSTDLGMAAEKTVSLAKKNKCSPPKLFACGICSKDFRNRTLLRKHIFTAHRGDARALPNFWCNETNCDLQFDTMAGLLEHLLENHRRKMETIKMPFKTFGDFCRWKNHLEENQKVKFLLSSGKIVNGKHSTVFVYECHRAIGLGKSQNQTASMDVMEKAVQEILPEAHGAENAHQLEIVEDEDFDSVDSRKGCRRLQTLSPCVAHLRAEVLHTEGTVEVQGCLTHYGHELDRLPRPPDCVLGRIRQQMQKLSRSAIETQLPSWSKHELSESIWKNLENQSPSSTSLFSQFRHLLKRTYEHLAVAARTSSQYFWIDQMENLADLFLVEQKLKCICERMSNKVKAAGETAFESNFFGLDLCFCLLSFANNREQLKKILKHGLDYADDARSIDPRFLVDFSSVADSPAYDPSVFLFKPKTDAAPLSELSHLGLRGKIQKKAPNSKKQRYARQLVGSEDDSDYDCWSDVEIADVVPRRWPPTLPLKQGTSEEKRMEKNMKRKIVPSLHIKPELREKILAMRVPQERESQDSEDAVKSKQWKVLDKRKNPKRKTRRSRRSRKPSSSEDSLEATSDQERPENSSEPAIVLQELRVEGPAGKKPRKVRVLASDIDREVATIVVESPTPQPEEMPKRPMISLLKAGTSLLKPPASQSLLKSTGEMSLLRPREPKPTEACEWKAQTPATPNDIFDRNSIDFDEGPLQTPQPPRIED